MTNPVCENLVRRDNPDQPGWSEWGYMADTANGPQFQSLNYGLESHLSNAESFYHLAAAGLCRIQGKPLAGQQVADIAPLQIPDPETVTNQPVTVEPEPVAQTVQETPPSPWVGTVLVIGVCVLAGAAFLSDRRTKANDTTSRPKYPDIFNQE